MQTIKGNLRIIVQAYQHAIRKWSPYLSASEFVVLLQLIDRTYGWQKDWVTIRTATLLRGDKTYRGMMISERTLFRALSSLERHGLISRTKHRERQSLTYSVNFDWVPRGATAEEIRPDVRPKRGAKMASNPCHSDTPPMPNWHTKEGIEGEDNLEKVDHTGAPEPAAPDPGPDTTNDFGPDKGERASARGKASPQCPPSIISSKVQLRTRSLSGMVQQSEMRWRGALAKNYPNATVHHWTQREIGMMKRKAEGWQHVRQISFSDFIEWCAINWPQIMRKQFKWMAKQAPPAVPDLGFFVSFMSQFADCWGDDKFREWLNSKERTEQEKLMAQGMTSDEASAEIGKRRAVEKMRKENRKASDRVALRRRALDRKEKRVARMEHMPVHPQSKNATEDRRRKLLGDDFNALDPQKKTEDFDWANLPLLDPNWEPTV